MEPEHNCPRCDAALKPDAPEGLCPQCLVEAGFDTDQGSTAGARRPTSPPIELVERYFPEMEILGLIGAGGMGAVYKARQKQLDRLVAIKVLDRLGRDPAFVERFSREARALARLNHPNIVAVFDFGRRSLPLENRAEQSKTPLGGEAPSPSERPTSEDIFFLVMELVDGTTLRQLLAQDRISPEEALMIVPPICEALQFAHEKGVVHRDIKPENILIDKNGRVKVADFGVAQLASIDDTPNLTVEGQVVGTAHYMAPEQVEGPGEIDHRADIYSLGVVFYEMLTGELPLGRFPEPSKKVQIDVRLDEVVLKALEKEPDRRYQKASEVKTGVETAGAAVNGLVPATKLKRRLAAVAATLVLIGSMGLVWLSFIYKDANREAEESARMMADKRHESMLVKQAELRRLEFMAETGRVLPADVLDTRAGVAMARLEWAEVSQAPDEIHDAVLQLVRTREEQISRAEIFYRAGWISDQDLEVAEEAMIQAQQIAVRYEVPVEPDLIPHSPALFVGFEGDIPGTITYEFRPIRGDRTPVFSVTLPGEEPFLPNVEAVPDGDYHLHLIAPGYSRQFHRVTVEDGRYSLGGLSRGPGGYYSIDLWKKRYLVMSYYVIYGDEPDFDGPAVDFYRVAASQSGAPPVLRGDFIVWQGKNESRTYGPQPYLSRHRFARNFGQIWLGGREEFESKRTFDPEKEWKSGQISGAADRTYLIRMHGNSTAEHGFVKLLIEGVHDEAPEGVAVYEDTRR